MLQRIYGTAWADRKQLDEYLKRIEEAEKRDHRRIGRELDLFHIQEEGPGLVFWHPKGWAIWQVIEQYMRGIYRASGYQEVRGPQVLDVSLWKKSGHWDNYQDNMFFTESEKRTYALKPMNCPGHVQIFNHGLHSYRDLPMRYGEFGGLPPQRALRRPARHPAGARRSLRTTATSSAPRSRSRRKSPRSTARPWRSTTTSASRICRSRSPCGRRSAWARMNSGTAPRACCARPCGRRGGVGRELPGEGAFYAPKIEYHLRDAIGRTWQLGDHPGRLQ